MEDMLEQYLDLLRQIVDQPAAPVRQYSLATGRFRRVAPDPSVPLRHDRGGDLLRPISEAAESAPDRPAVRDAEGVLTYAALVRASTALAVRLRDGGIGPGDVVGVYAYRDRNLLTALLGVLHAGAAFAIFDPAYPAARLITAIGAAKPTAWLQLSGAGDLPQELSNAIRAIIPQLKLIGDPGRLIGSVKPNELEVTGKADADRPAYITFVGPQGAAGVVGTQRPVVLQVVSAHVQLNAVDRFCLLPTRDPLLRMPLYHWLWVQRWPFCRDELADSTAPGGCRED
jgi:non-ribosomal peptide synthetase component F